MNSQAFKGLLTRAMMRRTLNQVRQVGYNEVRFISASHRRHDVDATGVPSVIEQAFNYLKPRGQYLQFGVAPNHATINLRPYDVFHKDWTFIGSFALCYTFQPAIAWLTNGVVDVQPLVSHTLPLSDFPNAFQSFADGKTLKVHLRPSQ